MERLKTGTPPRLHKDSLDYSKMIVQPGEDPPPFFGWRCRASARMFHVEQAGSGTGPAAGPTPMFHVEQLPPFAPWVPGSNQIPCWLTHTNETDHPDHFGESGRIPRFMAG